VTTLAHTSESGGAARAVIILYGVPVYDDNNPRTCNNPRMCATRVRTTYDSPSAEEARHRAVRRNVDVNMAAELGVVCN
jgi:hypothetical protein